jgi:hypothetical protein
MRSCKTEMDAPAPAWRQCCVSRVPGGRAGTECGAASFIERAAAIKREFAADQMMRDLIKQIERA